jgi:hypothetical protein
MVTKQPNSESFDESQSIQVIREMIQVSQKKLKNDGILFVLWGWIAFYGNITGYIVREFVLTYQFHRILDKSGYVLGLLAFAFTIYYMWKQRKKVQTYIGISIRYVWISMFVCFVLINLIQFNVLHSINFELQHPIFMVIIAFATVVTGGIIRYKLIAFGGIIFGLIALLSSYFSLPYQLLLESIAWLIAFIIPGHILFAKRKS